MLHGGSNDISIAKVRARISVLTLHGDEFFSTSECLGSDSSVNLNITQNDFIDISTPGHQSSYSPLRLFETLYGRLLQKEKYTSEPWDAREDLNRFLINDSTRQAESVLVEFPLIRLLPADVSVSLTYEYDVNCDLAASKSKSSSLLNLKAKFGGGRHCNPNGSDNTTEPNLDSQLISLRDAKRYDTLAQMLQLQILNADESDESPPRDSCTNCSDIMNGSETIVFLQITLQIVIAETIPKGQRLTPFEWMFIGLLLLKREKQDLAMIETFKKEMTRKLALSSWHHLQGRVRPPKIVVLQITEEGEDRDCWAKCAEVSFSKAAIPKYMLEHNDRSLFSTCLQDLQDESCLTPRFQAEVRVNWGEAMDYCPGVTGVGYCWLGAYVNKHDHNNRKRSLFKDAVEIDPTYSRAWSNLGTVAGSGAKVGDVSYNSLECFIKAVETGTHTNAFAWNALGEMALKGRIRPADDSDSDEEDCYLTRKREYEVRIIGQTLDHPETGTTLPLKLYCPISAAQCFARAVQIDPTLFAAAWCNLGVALFAEYGYDDRVRESTDESENQFSLGSQYTAIRCLVTALEIDPNFTEAWDTLGNLLTDLDGRINDNLEKQTVAELVQSESSDAFSNPSSDALLHDVIEKSGKLISEVDIAESLLRLESTDTNQKLTHTLYAKVSVREYNADQCWDMSEAILAYEAPRHIDNDEE